MTRWFLHIDADAFFASVEQCLHKELRGKPIVTGRDGSIGVALSYEAKRLGVERAMPIHLVRQSFPTVTMVASDYAMYQLYSDRMIALVKTLVPQAVRKSVDECAAEITNLVQNEAGARSLATELKALLEEKLWCTFSVGVAPTPLLAKMASGMEKPSGLSVVADACDTKYRTLPIGKVTGLGTRMCARLQAEGVGTVEELLVAYPRIKSQFSVVLRDIVLELSGTPAYHKSAREVQSSMNRARSFTKTCSRTELQGQLALNLEHVLRQLRRQRLVADCLSLTLKTTDRVSAHDRLHLPHATRDPQKMHEYSQMLFERLFQRGVWYRYVSVTLSGLRLETEIQDDLFGERKAECSEEILHTSIDALNQKYGTALVSRGSTLVRPKRLGAAQAGRYPIVEVHSLLPGEAADRRLQYPYLGSIT